VEDPVNVPAMVTGTRRPRVLVVDDDRAVREVMSLILQSLDAEVHAVSDAAQALGLLQRQAFDILFVDFHMPVISGLELSSMVRPLHPAVPIVLVTGDPPSPAAAERAGITRILSKPFALREVMTCLTDALHAAEPPRAGCYVSEERCPN
jgi:CheY-like chemotaxis protein